MIDEDAAQKSDGGEKFNGSSQKRKRPKKVNCWSAGCIAMCVEMQAAVETGEVPSSSGPWRGLRCFLKGQVQAAVF